MYIKILILILILTSASFADTLVIPTVYSTNGQVTASNLNGDFSAVAAKVNGGLDNTNANTTSGYRFFETRSSLPSAGDQGRTIFLTTDNTLNFDNGSTFTKDVSVSSPTNGDILYYNSGWQKLAIGSNNKLLSTNGSIPSWGFTVGTGASNILQLDAGSKIPAVDASQVTGLVGTDQTGKVATTVYTAATNGFFSVCVGNLNGFIFSDAANPPTTAVGGVYGGPGGTACAFALIHKNMNYKYTVSSGSAVSAIFTPIGG